MEKVGSILYLYRKSLCHSMSCSLYTPAPQNLWAQIHDCTWISQCLLCCSCYRTFVRLREYQESGNECLKEYHFSISAFNKTQQPPELRQVFCWESPGQPGILCMLSSKLTEWGPKTPRVLIEFFHSTFTFINDFWWKWLILCYHIFEHTFHTFPAKKRSVKQFFKRRLILNDQLWK